MMPQVQSISQSTAPTNRKAVVIPIVLHLTLTLVDPNQTTKDTDMACARAREGRR